MLISTAAYLMVHLLAYALFLRHRLGFCTERGILLYHLGSAAVAGLASLVAYALVEPAKFGAPGIVFVLAAHGIYSLSFLEVWSLAEGGYSLQILGSIARAQAEDTVPDFVRQAQVGDQKQRDRLEALKKLEMIAIDGGVIRLTARGRTVSSVLLFFVRWSNARRSTGGP